MEYSLKHVATDIDRLLAKGANNRKSAMHTPVVVTKDADARIMVLRHYDRAERTLRFHTDVRSPKVEIIRASSSVGVLFYDAEEKTQLRCRGVGEIQTDTALARAAWDGSDTYARRCYLGAAPGEARNHPSSGLPEWAEGKRPSEADLAPVRGNFAVLLVRLEKIDWYHLASDGHRRALFEHGEGRWLTP